MSGKLKIREIARQTGVSVSTVSRALAGKANISAHNRQRVLECAQANGVLAALSPARLLFSNITVFAPKRAFDLRADIFYYKVIQGIRDAIAASDTRLSYCAIEEIDADAPLFLKKLGTPECNAAILIGIDDPELHAHAANLGKPCVLINSDDDSMRLDAVSPDHRAIGRFSAKHLIEHGHRDILVLMCLRRNTLERRLDGIREAFVAHNIAFDASRHLVTTTGFSAEEAREALAARLADIGRVRYPTAILAGGDFMASGAIAELLDQGVAIPGEISVMSMDAFNLAETHDIALTAVHVPRDELGAEALRLLQLRIASPDAPRRRLLLSGKLVMGNSVKRLGNYKNQTLSQRHHCLYSTY